MWEGVWTDPSTYKETCTTRTRTRTSAVPYYKRWNVGKDASGKVILWGDPSTCPCFSHATATACRLRRAPSDAADARRAYADCFGGAPTNATTTTSAAAATPLGTRVRMAALSVGDLILAANDKDGTLYADKVVALPTSVGETSEAASAKPLLTLHHASGALTLTPTHEVWADGRLVPASEVRPGAVLRGASADEASGMVVERVVSSSGAVINPVVCGNRVLASDGEAAPPVLATTMTGADAKYAALCDA